MVRAETEPVITIIRARVLKISAAVDGDGNPVSVAHFNLRSGEMIIALGENHGINPDDEVDIVQQVQKYPSRANATSSRIIKAASPPTP